MATDCQESELKTHQTGKRERNRRRNQSLILFSARECFRLKGYENTTIRDIVRQTGLAAGTFYNYFSSKQDIFAALLNEFVDQLNSRLSQARVQNSSPEDVIRATYHALFQTTAQDPLVYELAHHNDRAIRELFGSDILGLALLTLQDDIERAMSRGLLPNVDEEYLCAAFTGVGYELSLRLAQRAKSSPDTASSEADKASVFATQLFAKGLDLELS